MPTEACKTALLAKATVERAEEELEKCRKIAQQTLEAVGETEFIGGSGAIHLKTWKLREYDRASLKAACGAEWIHFMVPTINEKQLDLAEKKGIIDPDVRQKITTVIEKTRVEFEPPSA